jgi:negative regulator of flagellin synthesis FlgM
MKVNSATPQAVQNKDVAGTGKTKKTDKSSAPESTQSSQRAGDTTGARPEISAKAKEFSKAKEVANKAPDVREDKISELKKKIAAGTYQVSADAIADKMVDEHIAAGIG